jgi:hypothetical protein
MEIPKTKAISAMMDWMLSGSPVMVIAKAEGGQLSANVMGIITILGDDEIVVTKKGELTEENSNSITVRFRDGDVFTYKFGGHLVEAGAPAWAGDTFSAGIFVKPKSGLWSFGILEVK